MKATDFESVISHLEEHDPQSPEALDARLEYADFLTQPAESDCHQRLINAQSQLDTVAARPAVNVVLPLGPARIADGEYRIHLAQATCGGDYPALKSELQKALEAAQNAVVLYRNALDYPSTTIMQFNVAVTYHLLGDTDAALSALESAIGMDREYGFRKDAQDNSRLLLQWRDGKATDAAIAAMMKDFPARSAEFKFSWSNTDADINHDVSVVSIIDGKAIPSSGAVTLKRHIRADPKGWLVSNEPGNSSYDPGDWPADAMEAKWPMMYFIATALLETPDVTIGRDGDFIAVVNPNTFGTNLAAHVSDEVGQDPGSAHAIIDNVRSAFTPEFVEAEAMQDYGLQTGTWIGSKLEQGVWYQMSTPLFLPGLGLGHYLVQYDLNFAFTRQIPCTAETPDRLCAEVIVHATPNADALKTTLQDVGHQLNLSDRQTLHYWSITDLRLVVDPATLLPFVCDTRQAWYIALDGPEKSDPIIESQRTVSASVYH